MKRPEPTLFDLIEEKGADAGIREYGATSTAVDVRKNGDLGLLITEVSLLQAEIRGMLAVLKARRPIPYADPDE